MEEGNVVVEQLDQTSELLMYLAGELPHRQSMALERRLAADPALARELETLRELRSDFDMKMQALDEKRIPGQAMAVARISRAMRLHGVSLESDETLVPRRVLHMPAWGYPIAAAAAVVLVYVGWWAHQPAIHLTSVAQIATVHNSPTTSKTSPDQEQVMFAELTESFRDHNPTQSRSLESLTHVESELAAIASPMRDSLNDPFNNSPILDNEE